MRGKLIMMNGHWVFAPEPGEWERLEARRGQVWRDLMAKMAESKRDGTWQEFKGEEDLYKQIGGKR